MQHRGTLTAAIALMVGAIAPTTAHAVTYQFFGSVVDLKGGGPVVGVEVIATEPGVPGTAWSTTTASDGTWSIDAAAEEYDLYFDGGTDYQSGYRGCSGYLVPDTGSACTVGPDWEIPTTMIAAFASGRILDRATAAPVAGATVTAYREDGSTVIGSATTATDGTYRITGVDGDEIGLHVDGSSVGYGTGWFACAAGVIVPTFGEACTHSPGEDGDRYVDAIAADPPRFWVFSIFRRSITLFVLDAGTEGPILGYELTCRSRRTGEVTTAIYETNLQTRSGFDRGINRCTLEVLGPSGPGPEGGPRSVWVR